MMVSIICMSRLRKPFIICLWLAFWQTAAVLVHNSIMLVGPFEALQALWSLLPSSDFWRSVAGSFGRISTGFLLAFAAGILLGSLAYTAPLLEEILEPFMLFLKAVPVASFVILVLIWAGSRNLSVVISFLVVLPVIYVNTISGLESTDQKLSRIAKYRSEASGNGRGVPDAGLAENTLYLSSGAGTISGKRMPHCSWHELEVRCGSRGDRLAGALHRRTPVYGEDLSGNGQSVCLDSGDHSGERRV